MQHQFFVASTHDNRKKITFGDQFDYLFEERIRQKSISTCVITNNLSGNIRS